MPPSRLTSREEPDGITQGLAGSLGALCPKGISEGTLAGEMYCSQQPEEPCCLGDLPRRKQECRFFFLIPDCSTFALHLVLDEGGSGLRQAHLLVGGGGRVLGLSPPISLGKAEAALESQASSVRDKEQHQKNCL